MPNHVTTKITSPDAGAIEALTKLFKSPDSEVDFNNLIPMPKCISTEGVSFQIELLAKLTLGLIDLKEPPMQDRVGAFDRMDYGSLSKDLERQNAIRTITEGKMVKDLSDEDFQAFIGMLTAYRECKCLTWYDWSHRNWGTKWNAYSINIEENESSIMFQTAWAFPIPIAEAICAAFPEYTFDFKWADEDTGSNAGHIVAKADNFSGGEFENGSDEAYEMSIELGVRSADELKKIKGKWVFVDEE
jgi:hypothetical protein